MRNLLLGFWARMKLWSKSALRIYGAQEFVFNKKSPNFCRLTVYMPTGKKHRLMPTGRHRFDCHPYHPNINHDIYIISCGMGKDHQPQRRLTDIINGLEEP